MSLLMEALRKAEQQKRQAAAQQNATPAGTNTLELAPLPGQDAAAATPTTTEPADGQGRLPELPTRLEELDAQFFAQEAATAQSSHAATGGTKRPPQVDSASFRSEPASDAAAREAAQNLFAVKQADSGGRFGFAVVVGGLTLVAVVTIGGYLYWQLQPKGGLAAGPALVAAVPAVPAAAPDFPAPTLPSPQRPASAQPLPAAPPTDDLPAAPAAAERVPDAAARPASPPTAQRAPAPDAPIRLSATVERKVAPALERAHLAFGRGETDLARTAWLQALQSDRRNPDALRGLATLAQQEGQMELALDYYLRVLDVDPKDAQAVAGVLSLKGQANPQQAESRLKTLLAEQSDSPYLNFALGSLYAQGARWAEAQQAFFQAHVADPANPDILYNLAVSLDHLHQARLAAQYYAQALEAADRQRAGFDPAQAATRLKALRE